MKPFELPEDGANLKELLERHFGEDANYEIKESRRECCSVFPDGRAAVECTNYAIQVFRELEVRLEGAIPCRVMGFATEDNPASAIAQGYDGHDFAVVADRYIVDGWLKNCDCGSSRAVFDLEDPNDREDIRRLYGDTAAFQPLEKAEEIVRDERVRMRRSRRP